MKDSKEPMIIRFRRSTGARRFGRGFEHHSKRMLVAIAARLLGPSPQVDPSDITDVHKILFVRPNFRMGNTLMSAPLIPAFRKAFPDATIDYLGAETTENLLENLGVNEVFCLSRFFVAFPWRFISLFRKLRKEQYDLAIDLSNGWSFSSVLYIGMIKARYRVSAGEFADRLCNILGKKGLAHMYDGPVSIAKLFDIECRDRPLFATSAKERETAVTQLMDLGIAGADEQVPEFAALFVGGHMKKRWPVENWISLAQQLYDRERRVVIFLGPEEISQGSRFRAELPDDICVIDPKPLRQFAALLEKASLVVTPDSGPMHLAVALDVPTVTLLTSEFSKNYYAPRGERDRALIRPSVDDVLQAL